MKRKQLKGDALVDYSFEHTRKRLWDRYGLAINREEYNVLCLSCESGDDLHSFVSDCESPHSIHWVLHRGDNVYFVYDINRKCITTVLPERSFR
jgi:hypothetical protein